MPIQFDKIIVSLIPGDDPMCKYIIYWHLMDSPGIVNISEVSPVDVRDPVDIMAFDIWPFGATFT